MVTEPTEGLGQVPTTASDGLIGASPGVLMLQPFGRGGVAFAFTAYGARIGVQLEDGHLLDQVLQVLPPNWAPLASRDVHQWLRLARVRQAAAQNDQVQFRVFVDDAPTDWPWPLAPALRVLAVTLEFSVTKYADPYLFVHAGAVGWQGRAIVLPGNSFAGKSTLVAALVGAGATYYSDEFAVLDAAGHVLPYPRPLSLRGEAGKSPQRIDLSDQAPRGHDAADALPIGLVALTTFESGGRWQCRRLAPASAMMVLCQHTVAIRHRPAAAFAVLGQVVASASVIEGTRGEAEDAAAALLTAISAVESRKGGAPHVEWRRFHQVSGRCSRKRTSGSNEAKGGIDGRFARNDARYLCRASAGRP